MTLQEAVDKFGYVSRCEDFKEGGYSPFVKSKGRQLADYEVTADVLPEYELQSIVGEKVI